jgi:hypothetical protein
MSKRTMRERDVKIHYLKENGDHVVLDGKAIIDKDDFFDSWGYELKAKLNGREATFISFDRTSSEGRSFKEIDKEFRSKFPTSRKKDAPPPSIRFKQGTKEEPHGGEVNATEFDAEKGKRLKKRDRDDLSKPLAERRKRTRVQRKSKEKITRRNRLRNFKPKAIKKSQGLRVGGKTVEYTTQQGDVKRMRADRTKDQSDLPTTSDVQLRSLLRDMSSSRSRLVQNLTTPFTQAVERVSTRKKDGQMYARDKKRLKGMMERLANESLKAEIFDLRRGVQGAVARGLRESAKDLRDLGYSVEMSKKKNVQRSKEIMREAEENITMGIAALRVAHEKIKKHGQEMIDSTPSLYKRRKNRFKKRVVNTHETNNVDGGSLNKAIQRIRRTEYQKAHHKATRLMMDEHGIRFCYWRLSVNHRWYGGNEICEILASSTGSHAKRKGGNLPRKGLYAVDEFPQLPHPNCMCQMEPAG